jgi:acyl-CoA thioesterase-1
MSGPPAPEPKSSGKLVLAFGDSLYAGYGLAPAEGFAPKLERALQAAGVAATVQNAGVSGDTSAAGRQRLKFTLDGLPRTPDLALVGLGGNDMLRGIDPGETEANLRAICTELRRRGIDVLLTGMLAAPNLGSEYGTRFNSLFPRVAQGCGARLYPFFLEGVVTDRRLMLPDRVHPNRQGIDRIVQRVAPLVASELKEAG